MKAAATVKLVEKAAEKQTYFLRKWSRIHQQQLLMERNKSTVLLFSAIEQKIKQNERTTFQLIFMPPWQLEVLKRYLEQLIRQLEENGRWAVKQFQKLPEKRKNTWFKKSASVLAFGSHINMEKSLLRLRANAEMDENDF